MAKKQKSRKKVSIGSALILVVVLTSLLAVVGVMFLMSSRLDKISATAITTESELDSAVESVLAKISQELIDDFPDAAASPGQEYYDYPDANNLWLASLEPYQYAANDYRWRKISDIYGLGADIGVPAVRVVDYNETIYNGGIADADGDGISDSKWTEMQGITTGKGEPVFAAVRIIDNGGMINVNTAYKFDPNNTIVGSDGSSQLQINLMALADRPNVPPTPAKERYLLEMRANYDVSGIDPYNLGLYKDKVVLRYYQPSDMNYTPFDISDELELRNRFVINPEDAKTRLEILWTNSFNTALNSPIGQYGSDQDEAYWFDRATFNFNDNYSYRHIATTYNMDRIISPLPNLNSGRMLNINRTISPLAIYNSLVASIDPPIDILPVLLREKVDAECAQLAVNLADFADDQASDPTSSVSVFTSPRTGNTYYGFEAQPFITEIAMKISGNAIHYAVELYNPFDRDIVLNPIGPDENYELDLGLVTLDANNPYSSIIPIQFGDGDTIPANGCFVTVSTTGNFNIVPGTPVRENSNLKLYLDFELEDPDETAKKGEGEDEDDISKKSKTTPASSGILMLRRKIDQSDPNSRLYVDKQVINASWFKRTGEELHFSRDVRDWRVVYPILETQEANSIGSLGLPNGAVEPIDSGKRSFFLPNPKDPVANPYLDPNPYCVTIGDISRILAIGNKAANDVTISDQLQMAIDENDIRLNLQDPLFKNIFQYFTVFDPSFDFTESGAPIDNDGDGIANENDSSEWKIPGRININTAPWYVIAQLPWVDPNIAQAIVAYRDKIDLTQTLGLAAPDYDRGDPNGRSIATGIAPLRQAPGFASIGELNFVIGGTDSRYRISQYGEDTTTEGDPINILGYPDLTYDDIINDYEERDIIFSRISNLVTVRSDVFTAYILVRLGDKGPQKRALAILDRSGAYLPQDKVKIIALQYVPDPE